MIIPVLCLADYIHDLKKNLKNRQKVLKVPRHDTSDPPLV